MLDKPTTEQELSKLPNALLKSVHKDKRTAIERIKQFFKQVKWMQDIQGADTPLNPNEWTLEKVVDIQIRENRYLEQTRDSNTGILEKRALSDHKNYLEGDIDPPAKIEKFNAENVLRGDTSAKDINMRPEDCFMGVITTTLDLQANDDPCILTEEERKVFATKKHTLAKDKAKDKPQSQPQPPAENQPVEPATAHVITVTRLV